MSLRAETEEIDLLRAINYAASSVNAGNTDLKEIIIVAIEESAEVVKLDSIMFEGDSAEFLNREEAESALQAVAALMNANPDSRYLVAGTTASAGGDEGAVVLSGERAMACIDVLVGLGASPDQMTAIGLGDRSWSLRTSPDEEGYGLTPEQLEANRAANRAVYIIKEDSDIAEEILGIAE